MTKRLIDVFGACVGLVLFFLPMVVIGTLLLITHGRPVSFSQSRPGRNGIPFRMYKFRTMRDACDEMGNSLSDSERLTSFGRLLRATSLDELPEFFNVLKGDMSLVGPRPLLPEYLSLYTSEQARRHEVRPGITGWAQINGRNAISWEEKFALDVWYVDNHTLSLDFKILLLTVFKVFKREGISQEGAATAHKFMGTNRHDQK